MNPRVANDLRSLLDSDAISGLGIDPSARAETLPLEAFAALANHVAATA